MSIGVRETAIHFKRLIQEKENSVNYNSDTNSPHETAVPQKQRPEVEKKGEGHRIQFSSICRDAKKKKILRNVACVSVDLNVKKTSMDLI